MSSLGLAFSSLFVWAVGFLWLRSLVHHYHARTDRVSFELWPVWRKEVALETGGAAHVVLSAVKWLGLVLQVVIGVPITLFFMILLPWLLIQSLLNG